MTCHVNSLSELDWRVSDGEGISRLRSPVGIED